MLSRAWLVALALVGCGRVGFDYDASATMDGGGTDAPMADSSAPDADASADGSLDDASFDAALVDDAGFCDETPCRFVAPQCGCIEGAACYPAGGAPRCIRSGTYGPGEPCSTHPDCAPGLGCVANGPDPSGVRLCRYLCDVGLDCPSGACLIGSVEGAGACADVCDPLANTGCGPGLSCYLITGQRIEDGANISATICAETGAAADGDPCDDVTRCAAGLVCERSTMTCAPLCELGSTCDPPYVFCAPTGLFIDGAEVGACRA